MPWALKSINILILQNDQPELNGILIKIAGDSPYEYKDTNQSKDFT